MTYYSNQQYVDKIDKIISMKGGIRISAFTNSNEKISIHCKNDHIFLMAPCRIVNGRWCAFCSCPNRKIASIERVKDFVEQQGGTVSGKIENMQSKLNFTCSDGHLWNASAASVLLNKTWCPHCSGHIKIDISVFHKIAEARGGKCLSNEYKTQKDKLEFICANNHCWKARAGHIKAGHWCPYCNIYLGEQIVRVFLEYLFDAKFPKYRAPWLVNEKNNKLELDGYCEKLGIAFEHHGIQHYGRNIFGQDDASYERMKKNDLQKNKICNERQIKLIIVPAIWHFTKLNNLDKVISDQFFLLGIKSPKEIIFKEEFLYSITKNSLLELQKIAIDKGGKCLSTVFINSKTHMLFECSKGHQWKAIPSNIKRGKWCRKCSKIGSIGNPKLNLKSVIEIRRDWNSGQFTKIALAKKYGISKYTINDIISGRTWKDK